MPKVADAQIRVVLVQAISTQWEKSARGGTNAALRNRVPNALKVADFKITADLPSYILHSVYYGGRNDFAEPIKSTVSTTKPTQLGGIFLDFEADTLAVSYQYRRNQGAPERYSGKVEAFNLLPGQWGRIRYNGRHVDCDNGDWWYEKWVYNVGLFTEFSPSAFLKTEPVKVTSYMALLK